MFIHINLICFAWHSLRPQSNGRLRSYSNSGTWKLCWLHWKPNERPMFGRSCTRTLARHWCACQIVNVRVTVAAVHSICRWTGCYTVVLFGNFCLVCFGNSLEGLEAFANRQILHCNKNVSKKISLVVCHTPFVLDSRWTICMTIFRCAGQ